MRTTSEPFQVRLYRSRRTSWRRVAWLAVWFLFTIAYGWFVYWLLIPENPEAIFLYSNQMVLILVVFGLIALYFVFFFLGYRLSRAGTSPYIPVSEAAHRTGYKNLPVDFSTLRRGGGLIFTDEIDILISSMQSMLISLNNQREELFESRAKLQELARTTLRSQEAERRYVARELHDQAGQLLVSLRYTIESLLSELSPAPPLQAYASPREIALRNRLSLSLVQIDETLKMIRALSHKMRPALLDVGDINLAMQEYCSEFEQDKPFRIFYEGAPMPTLREEIAISLFRFLQEALTNVLKHAHATEVRVSLAVEDDCVKMLVADNGIGARAASGHGGIGIAGMRERFQLLDGRVEAFPTATGFVIMARVPLRADLPEDKKS